MSTLVIQERRPRHVLKRSAPVFRPACVLAHAVLMSRATIALLAMVVVLDLSVRTMLPLGIATSMASLDDIGTELRLLLLGCIALLVLLRMARWRDGLRGLGSIERSLIVVLSICYLHVLLSLIGALSGLLPFRDVLGNGSRAVGESVWLSGLAGVLALARLAPRMLGLTFLLLAWCVPFLGMLGQAKAVAHANGLSHLAESAEGILPMLVPHLLAVGCVCLERAQR